MGDYIVTWDTRFGASYQASVPAMRRRARDAGVELPESISTAASPVLVAIVNHGRWVVPCPTCAGAEYARESGLFMCENCWNSGSRRAWLLAVFPEDREEIEAALIKRLSPQNRNWTPAETLNDLNQENTERGL